MNIEKEKFKLMEHINYYSDKLLNKSNYKEYEDINDITYINYSDKRSCSYFITIGDIRYRKQQRQLIKSTLQDINYERDNKWTEYSAVAFIDSVIYYDTDVKNALNYGLKIDNTEFPFLFKEGISKMFNVPISRLNTQVALFFHNLDNGIDKFHLCDWFSPYEILEWKYRNPEKLQSDLENNKISEKDLKLIKEIYGI